MRSACRRSRPPASRPSSRARSAGSATDYILCDDAVAWFDQALRVTPRLAVALFCKGICLAATGRAVEAYGALREAIADTPADGTYRVHFARTALALGRTKEAMDALELVARAMPELGPAMMKDPRLAALRDPPSLLDDLRRAVSKTGEDSPRSVTPCSDRVSRAWAVLREVAHRAE